MSFTLIALVSLVLLPFHVILPFTDQSGGLLPLLRHYTMGVNRLAFSGLLD